MKKRGASARKNSGRSSATASFSGRNSEVRTSSRTVRKKVSYVESEESEEVDEGKKKKSQKVQPTYCIFFIDAFIYFEHDSIFICLYW